MSQPKGKCANPAQGKHLEPSGLNEGLWVRIDHIVNSLGLYPHLAVCQDASKEGIADLNENQACVATSAPCSSASLPLASSCFWASFFFFASWAIIYKDIQKIHVSDGHLERQVRSPKQTRTLTRLSC